MLIKSGLAHILCASSGLSPINPEEHLDGRAKEYQHGKNHLARQKRFGRKRAGRRVNQPILNATDEAYWYGK
jgi:hypothetical protein